MTNKDKIDEIINLASDVLTSWELSFISNIENKLINNQVLSPKEEAKLNEIYEQRVR